MKSALALFFAIYLLFSKIEVFAQKTYDVCVYGGTAAGIVAAYSAKKLGKTVILIEPTFHLGGLTTGGLGQTDIGNKYAITGISRDFYRKIGKHYGKFEKWTFEPSVAKAIFIEMLSKAKIVPLLNHNLIKVNLLNQKIISIDITKTSNPKILQTIKAKMFIDCTYEGDLMAKAGVSYTVGRESNSTYGETYNGVQMMDKHQFPDGVDPFIVKEDSTSGLLWGISPEKLKERGTSDNKVQAYNYRMCLTDSTENQMPITKPTDYDATKYELLLRYLEIKQPHELNWALMHIQPMPHRKLDINNSGPFSTNLIGGNYDYANADFYEREKIKLAHENHIKGFFYFLGNDPKVPEHLRTEMKKWGYPKDEYLDNNHFSPQMYVREARRMVSDVVMTEQHCVGKEKVNDGIGLAAYTMYSHNTQRIIVKNAKGKYQVKNEGDVQMGLGGLDPYQISYKAIIPKKTECINLFVPVCLSASHIAFGSIRMEPVFMVLAQSAAYATSLAIDNNSSVQGVYVPILQKKLNENPLATGIKPEILIDNANQKQVKTRGNWTVAPKGFGRYGKDYLVADSQTSNEAIAIFSTKFERSQKHKAYIYIPQNKEHATEIDIKTKHLNIYKTIKINVNRDESDWYLIGEYNTKKNEIIDIEISTKKKGFLIADAVLWVPVSSK
jgi:FAD dependent oxidoreductase